MTQAYEMILVGGEEVGIRGLIPAIEAAMVQVKDASDETITAFLLKELRPLNYFPDAAKGKYGNAFLREYKDALTRYTKKPDTKIPLEIRMYSHDGKGMESLGQRVSEALSAAGLAARVVPVLDLMQMAGDGVGKLPALMINQKVVCFGREPETGEIRDWLEAVCIPS